jgi:hypothetical protein
MKKIILIFIVIPSIFLANRLTIVVSISPQVTFVQKITKQIIPSHYNKDEK